jgi:NAD(P)-dependent dehydrogenase (short-subunit alcohol dehydrogenase family)
METDVTNGVSTVRVYDAAEHAFGPVDSVIANAGMNGEGTVLELDAAAIHAVFGVNLLGVCLTVREGAENDVARLP